MRISSGFGLRMLATAVVCGGLVSFSQMAAADDGLPAAAKATKAKAIDGREIFAREWIPGDKRSHGGDGLGPMFNESSCVGCHNQGGIGGAGPASKNVDIVTAFHNRQQQQQVPPVSITAALFKSVFGELDNTKTAPQTDEERAAANSKRVADQDRQMKDDQKVLAKTHPGFEHAFSVVLHKQGTFAGYEAWRSMMAASNFGVRARVGNGNAEAEKIVLFGAKSQPESDPTPTSAKSHQEGFALMQQMRNEIQFSRNVFLGASQIGHFAVTRSQRNTTSLFGAGVIDAISIDDLKALEEAQALNKEVSGRVASLKDGKVGKFGWKGQTASLEDFVMTACAVELGLNVPDHPQAGIPQKPTYVPAGLDLDADECRALISYVGSLPAPKQRDLADETDAAYVNAGHTLFTTIGCAACHTQDVGEAKGIFSDLLLHDMGEDLGDTGSYGVFVPNTSPEGGNLDLLTQKSDKPAIVGATRLEWRTPPLWGVRDSAPYLHDGRADTLEQAIVMHGGESLPSAQRFFALSDEDRFKVATFMKSLIAP